MSLDKLPSIIENSKFNDKGLVETESELLVPAYVASQLAFDDTGKSYLDNVFYPKLKKVGVLALCPFSAMDEYSYIDNTVTDEKNDEENNKIISEICKILMSNSKFMVTIIEEQNFDQTILAETIFFSKKYGPVLGVRSDYNLTKNSLTPLIPTVRFFYENGKRNKEYYKSSANDNVLQVIKTLADNIRSSNI